MQVLNSEILESYLEINRAINRLVKLDADRLGVTIVQLKTLVKLATNPDIGLGVLADKLRLTKSTVSGVIERLVKNGFVQRLVPSENRRTVSIHLTDKGKQVLEQLYSSDSIFCRLNEACELPEKDLLELLRLQKMILNKLQSQEELH